MTTPTILYVYPVRGYDDYAARFVQSVVEHPPGAPCKWVICVNGGKPNSVAKMLFSPLGDVEWFEHDNTGFDLGAFQAAAHRYRNEELMLFLGASSFVQREGWLPRMITAYEQHGDGIYGSMANRGDDRVRVWPHIRTTGFWMNPKLMCAYPHRVVTKEQRYPFEHGPANLTLWVMAQKKPALVVSYTDVMDYARWDDVVNGFQKGDQSNILVRDKHTEPPIWYGDKQRKDQDSRVLPRPVFQGRPIAVQPNRIQNYR